MRISHETHANGGRFTTEGGSAELTYSRRDETTVVFDHTFVPPAQRGGGVAESLVRAGAEWARSQGLKIVPQCPYVDVLFKRKPGEFGDVAAS